MFSGNTDLLLRRLPKWILLPINIPNNKQTKLIQQSLKRFESCRHCSISPHHVLHKKITALRSWCGGRIDTKSVHVSVLFPVQKLINNS